MTRSWPCVLVLGIAARAAALPCQMDPKFHRASCDNPDYQAAYKAYNACAAQNQDVMIAAGYACVPRHQQGTAPQRDAPSRRGTPSRPATAPPPDDSSSGKPGYGRFGQAMVNATRDAKPRQAPTPAAPVAVQDGSSPAPADPSGPPSQSSFMPVLNQTAAPAFAPLQSKFGGSDSDTQQWLQRQRALKQKASAQCADGFTGPCPQPAAQ